MENWYFPSKPGTWHDNLCLWKIGKEHVPIIFDTHTIYCLFPAYFYIHDNISSLSLCSSQKCQIMNQNMARIHPTGYTYVQIDITVLLFKRNISWSMEYLKIFSFISVKTTCISFLVELVEIPYNFFSLSSSFVFSIFTSWCLLIMFICLHV